MLGKAYRWTPGALGAIHEGSEKFMIDILDWGNLVAINAGRVTIAPKDVQLVMRIREVTHNYKTDEVQTGPGGALQRQSRALRTAYDLQRQRQANNSSEKEKGKRDRDAEEARKRQARIEGDRKATAAAEAIRHQRRRRVIESSDYESDSEDVRQKLEKR